MCAQCDLIDYPVADCWRPCYQPGRRSTLPPAGRIFNQDDFDAQRTIDVLRAALKASQREAVQLRYRVEAIQSKKSTEAHFEGAEL